jgi:CRISPR/Cas system-associated protein Cas7 (RAMP superfamily)
MHTKFWSENLKGRDHYKSRHGWVYNVRMDLRKIGWEGTDWIHLAQDKDHLWALVNAVMNLHHQTTSYRTTQFPPKESQTIPTHMFTSKLLKALLCILNAHPGIT